MIHGGHCFYGENRGPVCRVMELLDRNTERGDPDHNDADQYAGYQQLREGEASFSYDLYAHSIAITGPAR